MRQLFEALSQKLSLDQQVLSPFEIIGVGTMADGSNIHLFECEMAPDNNQEWASCEIKIFTPHASFGKKEFMSKSQCSHLETVNLIIISLPCRLIKYFTCT